MIGYRTRQSGAARGCIKTVWPRLAIRSASSMRKVARAANARVTCAEEVGIEAYNYLGFVERVADVERLSKRSACAIVDVVAIDSIVLMPSRTRISLQQLIDLRRECRRCHRLGQDA